MFIYFFRFFSNFAAFIQTRLIADCGKQGWPGSASTHHHSTNGSGS